MSCEDETCTTCGCDTCEGDCTQSTYAPVRECVPEMTKPNHALGLDCERRKRKIKNKESSILTSNGKVVEFSDGSENDRIKLALVYKALHDGIVTVDSSGQLQIAQPLDDAKQYFFGRKDNVLGFHSFPNNSHKFDSSAIEPRNCGKIALIVCEETGVAKLAYFSGCETAQYLQIDAEGNLSCTSGPEIPDIPESACEAGYLVPYYFDTPELVVDKWPGLSYPWGGDGEGAVGSGEGSFGLGAPLNNGLIAQTDIKRLILYVEVGTYHKTSGAFRDIIVKVNNEKLLYDVGGHDQWGSNNGPGTGGSSNEGTVAHDGQSTATWEFTSNQTYDFRWKMRIYLKGVMVQHCAKVHSVGA